MDPDANLKEQRELIESIREAMTDASNEDGDVGPLDSSTIDDIDRLLDLTEALDNWIKNGGFLPADWRR